MFVVTSNNGYKFIDKLPQHTQLSDQVVASEGHRNIKSFADNIGMLTLLFESGLLLIDEYTALNQPTKVNVVTEFAQKNNYKVSSVRYVTNEVIADYTATHDISDDEASISTAESLQMFDTIIAKAYQLKAEDIILRLSRENNSAIAIYKVDGDLLDEVDSLKDFAFGKSIASAVYDGKEGVGQAKHNFDEATSPQHTEFEHVIYGQTGAIESKMNIRFTKTVTSKVGELCVTMRVHNDKNIKTLVNLDLPLYIQERIQAQLRKSRGAIIISGPTGSGKTTTLFGALMEYPANKLIQTIEDPIEIRSPKSKHHIVQNVLDTNLGYEKQLGGLLRLTPDGIYVGETRDKETADLVFQIAKSGHFVMTSTHANTASGIIPRLMDLGVEPFDIAAPGAVEILLAQRLVKKICPHCSLSQKDYEQKYSLLHRQQTTELSNFKSNAVLSASIRVNHEGCQHCYKGEVGRQIVIEMIDIKDEDREFIARRDLVGWQKHLNTKNYVTLEDEMIRYVKNGTIDISRALEHLI